MKEHLARQLIATLPIGLSCLYNPWQERCSFDTPMNTPEEKIIRLSHHLDCDATLILVGEAAGYQGCRYSGIAFTSERQLFEGFIPRVPAITHRLSTRKTPFSEPSATIVWNTLYQLGLAETTILWNALPLHPFKVDAAWSNRTPNNTEIKYGVKALHLLLNSYPEARIVAVGQKAAGILNLEGIPIAATVRHPANGGASLFAQGMAEAAKEI